MVGGETGRLVSKPSRLARLERGFDELCASQLKFVRRQNPGVHMDMDNVSVQEYHASSHLSIKNALHASKGYTGNTTNHH